MNSVFVVRFVYMYRCAGMLNVTVGFDCSIIHLENSVSHLLPEFTTSFLRCGKFTTFSYFNPPKSEHF